MTKFQQLQACPGIRSSQYSGDCLTFISLKEQALSALLSSICLSAWRSWFLKSSFSFYNIRFAMYLGKHSVVAWNANALASGRDRGNLKHTFSAAFWFSRSLCIWRSWCLISSFFFYNIITAVQCTRHNNKYMHSDICLKYQSINLLYHIMKCTFSSSFWFSRSLCFFAASPFSSNNSLLRLPSFS